MKTGIIVTASLRSWLSSRITIWVLLGILNPSFKSHSARNIKHCFYPLSIIYILYYIYWSTAGRRPLTYKMKKSYKSDYSIQFIFNFMLSIRYMLILCIRNVPAAIWFTYSTSLAGICIIIYIEFFLNIFCIRCRKVISFWSKNSP